MKKQSGFTLIELLLVLAIIGIISAIAIPALLSQRARARDKSATENMVGRVGDLVGQWDKWREAGLASGAAIASIQNYLIATTGHDANPWNSAGFSAAFSQTIDTGGAATSAAGFATYLTTLVTAPSKGQAKFSIQSPGNPPGNSGYIGGAVWLNASSTSDTVQFVKTKVTAVE